MIWTTAERRAWLLEDGAAWKDILGSERHTPAGDIVSASYIRCGAGIKGGAMRVYGRYAVVCIIDGTGKYSDALGAAKQLGPGDVILVFPELAHNYHALGKGWNEFHVVFKGPVFDLLRPANLLVPHVPTFRVDNVDELLTRFEEVLSDDTAGPLETVYRCAAYVTELVARNAEATSPVDRSAPWLKQALRTIDEQLVRPLDINELAQSVSMSYDAFRKAFRKSMGVTVGQYHLARRVSAARSLLEHTHMTVRQIADNLGFVDEYHFSNRFQKEVGTRPGAYRTACRMRIDPDASEE